MIYNIPRNENEEFNINFWRVLTELDNRFAYENDLSKEEYHAYSKLIDLYELICQRYGANDRHSFGKKEVFDLAARIPDDTINIVDQYFSK